MNCSNPQRIFNPYLRRFMYVPCRKCENCLISHQNEKAILLRKQMEKTKYNLFLTLTYDNNHIPFIVNGFTGIYRGTNFEPLETDTEIFAVEGGKSIRKFAFSDCYSVLYYRDIQLFLKRLRKSIYGKFGKYKTFRYFAVGEYGTYYGRAHYHIIISTNESAISDYIRSVAYRCWRMCDESRFDCTIAGAGSINYVSSYCSNYSYNNGVQQISRFKSKTWRSKEIDYGVSADEYESVKAAFTFFQNEYRGKRPFARTSSGDCFNFGELVNYPSGFLQTKRYNTRDCSVSTCLIPQRIFGFYCSIPKAAGQVSFSTFCQMCRDCCYFLQAGVTTYFCHINSSSDFAFYRSYKRYLFMFDYVDTEENFEEFIYCLYRIWVAYKCLLIRTWMETYEGNSVKYIQQSYQTWCVPRSKWQLDAVFSRFGVQRKDIDFSLISKEDSYKLQSYRLQHHKKLLPKHYNDLLQIL